MYRWEVCTQIAAERLIAVLRLPSAGQATAVGEALARAGLRVLEVALTTPDGLAAIGDLRGARDGRGADGPAADGRIVGAGTVLDAPTARAAILAGAQFLVSPSLVPEVVVTGHRYGVPVMPGTHTPTEIQQALEAGADMVKVFPASELGPGFISAVRAALPQAPLVPTGGISAATAREWLDAGAVAVGVGGSLVSGSPDSAGERAEELLAAVAAA